MPYRCVMLMNDLFVHHCSPMYSTQSDNIFFRFGLEFNVRTLSISSPLQYSPTWCVIMTTPCVIFIVILCVLITCSTPHYTEDDAFNDCALTLWWFRTNLLFIRQILYIWCRTTHWGRRYTSRDICSARQLRIFTASMLLYIYHLCIDKKMHVRTAAALNPLPVAQSVCVCCAAQTEKSSSK